MAEEKEQLSIVGPNDIQPISKTAHIQRWYDEQPIEEQAAFDSFCETNHSGGAIMGYLMQRSVYVSIDECNAWLKRYTGVKALRFNQSSRDYIGIDPVAVQDRAIVELTDATNLMMAIIMGDPNYDAEAERIGVANATRVLPQLIKERNAAVLQAEKIRARMDREVSAWSILARCRQVFMSSDPVRGSEHIGWLDSHWDFVMSKLNEELQAQAAKTSF